ncbi:hypothetical protein MNBD_PLANCTO02-1445 [hydrothermal vent metagenome]|uniref:Uncharacterized protein n=1 Tax=hydrothermal vent metagenome TaxID=652676 RepID=A0A3B1E8A3_9ZZZZ
MMNELVAQRLNLTDDHEREEEPFEEKNNISTIDETLFHQLISLSEPEQIVVEQTTVEENKAEENKIDSKQFDHLLEQVPGIAEVINSFTSAKIQREVIEALASAYEQEQSMNRDITE